MHIYIYEYISKPVHKYKYTKMRTNERNLRTVHTVRTVRTVRTNVRTYIIRTYVHMYTRTYIRLKTRIFGMY